MAIAVDASTTFQSIDGFGAADPFVYAGGYSTAVADLLFSPSKGLGLSILRSELWVDTGNSHGWPMYYTPMDSSGGSVEGDFSVELQAYSRGCRKFFVTCWAPQLSAPFSWLSGGSQNGSLLLSHYADMATAFTTYLDNSLAAGVPTTHISMMNEPDITPSYAQTAWTTSLAVNFVKNNLGPALVAWGAANPSWRALTNMSSPGLIFGEVSDWHNFATWVNAVEGDATAKGYVTTYAAHQYSGAVAPPVPCSHPIWQTEVFHTGAYDTSITGGLAEANLVYNGLITGNASGWVHWFAEDVSDNNNSGLVGTNAVNWNNPALSLADWNSPTFPKQAYCLGQFSKFIRPGSTRIAATGAPGGVNAIAFLLSQGGFGLVCINTNGSPTAITVNVSHVGVGTVAPWLTDSTHSLTKQASIAMSGGSFSTTLPANSVTTFVSESGAGSSLLSGDLA